MAASAIWIQTESTMAAIQSGWITSTRIRVLNLLGKGDHVSAIKAFRLSIFLSALCVSIGNIFLYLFRVEISRFVSNEDEVQRYFCSFVWILCMHTQLRITVINLSSILIPIGRPYFYNLSKLTNYFIGVPLVICVGLTSMVYTNDGTHIIDRMSWIFSLSPINMLVRIVIVSIFYCCCLNWKDAAKIVVERANQDAKTSKNSEGVSYYPLFDGEDQFQEEDEESTTIEFMRI